MSIGAAQRPEASANDAFGAVDAPNESFGAFTYPNDSFSA